MKLTPWILQRLYVAEALHPQWNVSWVAIRERHYLSELCQGPKRLIAKYLRSDANWRGTTRILSHEAAILRRLSDFRSAGKLSDFAPHSEIALPNQGLWLQQCLPGQPLRSPDILENPELRKKILHCLQELASIGSEDPLNACELLSELRPHSGDQRNYRIALDAAQSLNDQVRPVWAHNDLNPSNILLHRNKIAIIDWTFAAHRALPCFDWLDLLAHSALQHHRSSWRQVAELFAEESSTLSTLCLSGATELLGCARKAAYMLTLYRTTRLNNLSARYDLAAAA